MILERWQGVDVAALTALLRRAYRPLLDSGLQYLTATQDDDVTRRRIAGRECWVVRLEGALVGTVTVTPPGLSSGCAWYERLDVAVFGQFAVEPRLQGSGLGSGLLAHAEERARLMGAAELALDTSELATHLVAYYGRRGYRPVDEADWDVTNYRSVVMSKSLIASNSSCE